MSETNGTSDGIESVEIRTDDGVGIAARIFHPPAHVERRGAVLVAGAMGVAQGFYKPFAEWLAQEGFVAATFDYRGMGDSKRGSLRDEAANIETWAEKDAAAVLRALAQRSDGLPITWVGHSLGAQIVGMTPGHERVAKVITVAAGSGYWRENAEPLRKKVWIFWWGAVPLATPVFGYFPGKMLGMVGDLPRGVVMQWRRWCMHPEYAVGVEGEGMREKFASVRAPIVALSFDDDEMMSEANTHSLHSFFTATTVQHVRVQSLHRKSARIGHFGFFRRPMRESLWSGLARAHFAEAC